MRKAIVVGSGAGGCMAAKELAACGLSVTVLEAGHAFKPFAWDMSKLEPVRRAGLFFDERMISLLFPEMRIDKAQDGLVHVAGRAVGGTTTLATGNALRYDRYLADIGIDLDAEFAELETEVPQTTEHRASWSELTERLFKAFDECHGVPRADLTDPDIRDPRPVNSFYDQDPVPSHGDLRFTAQITGSHIGHFISELPQEPAEQPVQFKTEPAFSAHDDLIIKVIRIKGQRNPADNVQVFIRDRRAMSKLQLFQQFPIRYDRLGHLQPDPFEICGYFLHFAEISSKISITVSSCSRVTYGVGLFSRIHSAKCFSSL